MIKKHEMGWKGRQKNVLHQAVEMARKNHYRYILEFGVYRGKSLSLICKLLDKQRNEYNVFGFDCFTGFPKSWKNKHGEIIHGGIKNRCDTNGQVPSGSYLSDVIFFVGLFEQTLLEYKQLHDAPIALLHLDCDLYDPTMEVLQSLNKNICKGTIIVYNDWHYKTEHDNDSIHQEKAHNDWSQDQSRKCNLYDWQVLFDPSGEKNTKEFSSMIAQVIS